MKQIRSSKFSKIIAYYLVIMMFLQVTQPMQMYALTSGPTQPEFNAFTPIGTSDMVDLASGDFNYNIPVMDVGGYPINLAYNSGVTMDQEASWVGLGWNLNVGQIERQVRGLPDDFRGDLMHYENDLRDNVTIGTHFGLNAAFSGFDALNLGVGLGVQWNNYEGITFKPSYGIGFELCDNVSVGLDFSSAVGEGASVSPSVSIHKKTESKNEETGKMEGLKQGGTLGLGFNSRKGVENLNFSYFKKSYEKKTLNEGKTNEKSAMMSRGGSSLGGSITFNNNYYTPSKRIGFTSGNFSFNGSAGGEVYLAELQGHITGYGSYQSISDAYKDRYEKAYGYENTQYKQQQNVFGSGGGVLDFNRENERTVTENTTVLPVTNYTYDTYSISGQGVSGMFRPYRSQVSYVYNDRVTDNGNGATTGVELGGGNAVHWGGQFTVNPSTSYTGGWFGNNNVLPYFNESYTDNNNLFYEPTTFKLVGGLVIDSDNDIYTDKLVENKAVNIKIGGGRKNRRTEPYYMYNDNLSSQTINSKIKKSKRFLRNQLIQKVTAKESEGDILVSRNSNAKDHHTAGIKVLQTDGSTYVYGNTAYNIKKVEATYDVSALNGNLASGLVSYTGSLRGKNNSVSDKYVNRITTPKYAHSYLLSTVLSSDYEDVDGNGPSLTDLGSFTQFTYKTMPNIYSWRIPFNENTANFNNGLFSNPNDEKANYLYGQKELKYLDKIITKTHVAFFDLEDRKDAIGTKNDSENGGAGVGRLKKIKSIRLYSRPEITVNNQIVDPIVEGIDVQPIKTAHFVYSYNLCGGNKLVNKVEASTPLTDSEVSYNGGKLTLEKVYFTYRNSSMGKYTPYTFYYGKEKQQDVNATYSILDDEVNNPPYDNKGFDIWGNYKPNDPTSGNSPYASSPLSTSEYPFVEQNKESADQYTGAWTLKNVSLPSGGLITIETESDDYQFVQEEKAMQMFKVVGAGDANDPISNSTNLYNGNNHIEYLYVKVNEIFGMNEGQRFIDNYLKENYDEYIYFRFLLNMTGNAVQKEYVSGYFQIDQNLPIKTDGSDVVGIPVKKLKRDGGTNGSAPVNPISKTGWGFGRTYLNREVYSLGGASTNTSFSSIVQDLVGSIREISHLVTGPNLALQQKGCSRTFNPNKSWIRLENPNGHKLGGGLRVKSIKLSDEWNSMLEENGGTSLESMEYGQEYSYEINGKSSGVATYEPNASSENPLVKPFFPKNGSYGEKIASPRENNYVEKPFGEGFFPSSKITYSSVTVKNLKRENLDDQTKVGKHATGKVVTNFYTTKDFPTKVGWTKLTGDNVRNDIPSNLGSLFASIVEIINVESHLTMSQGFSIETNDMDGKMKSQEVYPEGVDDNPISRVEYIYNVSSDDKTALDNNMLVINSKGEVEKRLIGLDYDVINDFNESYSDATVAGLGGNVGAFLAAIFPVIVPAMIPKMSSHRNQLRTAVTTKHVHKTGILVEKIATDLGSTVSTKNLLWDAESGQVLLTETVNEYGDNYYSFSYPAYWMYEGMGLASTNIGVKGVLKAVLPPRDPSNSPNATNPFFNIKGFTGDVSTIFHVGDELYSGNNVLSGPGGGIGSDIGIGTTGTIMWVVGFSEDKTGVLLMDRFGNYINKCADYNEMNFKIVRSGFRNLQSASMASVTSMINPLQDLDNDDNLDFNFDAFNFDGNSFNPRVINASAVVYKDFWRPQTEVVYYPEYDESLNNDSTSSRPGYGYSQGNYGTNPVTPEGLPHYPYGQLVNPFVWNIKGDWRAEKSYAYLTGRNSGDAMVNNPRNEGFYNKFNSFYQLDENANWFIDETDWTYASSVTQYSPYGPEIENKDALNRYSSAQYGYKYTLPTAVASNSKYRNMGFESFEAFSPHFSILTDIESITRETSHTGNKSVKIPNGEYRALMADLLPETPLLSELNDCPVDNGNGGGGNCGEYYVFDTNSGEIQFSNHTIDNIEFQVPQDSPVWFNFNQNNSTFFSIEFDRCDNQALGGPYNVTVNLTNGEIIKFTFNITLCNAGDGVQCIGDTTNSFNGGCIRPYDIECEFL